MPLGVGPLIHQGLGIDGNNSWFHNRISMSKLNNHIQAICVGQLETIGDGAIKWPDGEAPR